MTCRGSSDACPHSSFRLPARGGLRLPLATAETLSLPVQDARTRFHAFSVTSRIHPPITHRRFHHESSKDSSPSPLACSLHSRSRQKRTRSSDQASSTTLPRAPTPFRRSSRANSNFRSGRPNSTTGSNISSRKPRYFTTAEQTRTQIVTMYNLAYQMATMPQNLEARYKADWSQWQSLAAPPNSYGNTSPLVNALNFGGLPQAQQGYNSAYVQPQSYPSGSYSSLDARTQATVANQYATSELAQSTTTSTLSDTRDDPDGRAGVRQQACQFGIGHLLDRSQPADPKCPARQDQLRNLLQIHSQQDTTSSSWLRSSNSFSPRSSRLMRRTVPSTTPITSSRTSPTPCRT